MKRRFTSLMWLCTATLLFAAGLPALALDDVTVRVTNGDEGLQRKLESASMLNRELDEQSADKSRFAWLLFWRKNDEPPPETASPMETLANARAEYKRLLTVLYGEGHYSGVISVKLDGREAADIPPLSPPASIRNAVVTVQPGPAFIFSEATVQPLAPDTELPDEYARGETARSTVIGDAAQTATEAWRDIGYAKVDLASEDITANHADARLASRLTLATGPKLRFGPTVVSGNDRMRTDRIVAIAGIPTGEVYDPAEVEQAADRLRRSQAFRSVSVSESDTVGPGDQLPIEIEVLEQKRRRLGFGVELDTDEGGRFNAYWMHRNLLGGAENLRFDLDIENIGTTEPDNGTDYSLGVVLSRPATFNPDVDAQLRGNISHVEDPGYTADTAEIGGGIVWYISPTLTFTGGMDFRYSDVEDAFGTRQYTMVSFPLGLEWDTRNIPLDATEGYYLDAELTPFVGIDNMENGAQLLVDGRTYWGFGEEKNTVLAGRMQLGSLFGPEIPDAPQDYLFFAGGGGSVRGQPFQSLGTGEIDGTIIGGRSYVALSGELRSYVWNNIGLVGFYDAGYVGAEEFYDGSGNWMSGAGIGLRYKTGFGPIRFDVATPVSGGPDDAPPIQIYIGVGQAF